MAPPAVAVGVVTTVFAAVVGIVLGMSGLLDPPAAASVSAKTATAKQTVQQAQQARKLWHTTWDAKGLATRVFIPSALLVVFTPGRSIVPRPFALAAAFILLSLSIYAFVVEVGTPARRRR